MVKKGDFMRKIILSSIIVIFTLSAITAAGKPDAPPAGPGTASGEGRSISVNYHIEKTNEGSRSEGRSHVLAVNNFTLPDVFTLVYAADVLYRFETADQPWDDCGYVPDRNSQSAPFAETDTTISDEDWSLGWYEGAKKKKGTPRSWVYVERDRNRAFVNPDELDRFVSFMKWEVMPRETLVKAK
jgi:hypothetical protein